MPDPKSFSPIMFVDGGVLVVGPLPTARELDLDDARGLLAWLPGAIEEMEKSDAD